MNAVVVPTWPHQAFCFHAYHDEHDQTLMVEMVSEMQALRDALDITTRQLRLYAGTRDTATLAIISANEALLTNSAPSAKTPP